MSESGGLTLRAEDYIVAARGREASTALARAKDQASGRDRRAADRFDLDNTSGSLIHKGTKVPCSVVDISLTGCCVRTPQPFLAGAQETVKVVFPIFEMTLSIWGVIKWVGGEHLFGIEFRHPTAQSKNQMAGLLTCLVDKSATEVVKKAMAAIVAEPGENPILHLEHPLAATCVPEPELEPEPEPEPGEVALECAEPHFEQLSQPIRPTLSGEEQVLIMEPGDSPASLTLPGDDSVYTGDVVDLSLTGCLMRLSRTCNVRLMAQAEVTFHMQGLPFRLGAVTQEMHDKRTVEIRFVQMSRRKRDDLNQAITELIELSNRKNNTS